MPGLELEIRAQDALQEGLYRCSRVPTDVRSVYCVTASWSHPSAMGSSPLQPFRLHAEIGCTSLGFTVAACALTGAAKARTEASDAVSARMMRMFPLFLCSCVLVFPACLCG